MLPDLKLNALVTRHAALRQASGRRNLLHEEIDEVWNVVAPLRQRRDAQRHDGQPVEQVLAETPLGDVGREPSAESDVDASGKVSLRAQKFRTSEPAVPLPVLYSVQMGPIRPRPVGCWR